MLHAHAIVIHSENPVATSVMDSVMSVTFLVVFLLFATLQTAAAAEVKLAWDAVADARVDHYQIHTGTASGQYTNQLTTAGTTQTVAGLDEGATYYFAARACDADETLCSPLSNELTTAIPHAAPVAKPSVDTRAGTAPLTVNFSQASTGTITSYVWDFGDGTTSTTASATHDYPVPGSYPVRLTVSGPGGSSTDTATVIEVGYPAPVAAFTAATLTGEAPLNVAFRDDSTGRITRWNWNFGDGNTSDQAQPTHLYTQPGTYAVTLTVEGPGGVQTLTRDGYIQVAEVPVPEPATLPLEIGEVEIDDTWQRVDFLRTFADPIVVVKALSANGGAPAVIRVKDIDPSGFSVRVQEWEYLGGAHALETAGYLVMERGRHQLPDGVWVEAGSLRTKATNAFQYQTFGTPFAQAPVVFAAVASVNEEDDAVNARLKQITDRGFYVGMREQEANKQVHLAERIDYIAWEVSEGVVAGLRYEVGRTGNTVTSKISRLSYQSVFERTPVFVADAQTTNGGDSSGLRWKGLNPESVEMWVQEEQSKDAETDHGKEDVGYFLADVEL